MKKLITTVISLCVVISLAVCIGTSFAAKTPVGTDLSGMNTTDIDGNAVTGEIFKGYKLTYMNLWATWCGPCLSELPHIQEINADEEYAQRGLNVLGLLWEDSSSTVTTAKKTLAKYGCTYTCIRLLDDTALNTMIDNSGDSIPVSFLIDETGMVISYKVGSMNLSQMKAFINSGFDMVEDEPTPTPTDEPTPTPTDEPTPTPTETPTDEPTPTPTETPTEEPTPTEDIPEPDYMPGDVNNDGKLNSGDAVLVLRKIVDLVELNEKQAKAADIDEDGKITTGDAVRILRISVGLYTEPEN